MFSSFTRADGDALDVGNSKMAARAAKSSFNFRRDLRDTRPGPSVHSGEHVFDPRTEAMNAWRRVCARSPLVRHQNDGQVRRGRACWHVSRVLFVARRVRNDELRREVAK